MKDNIFIFNGAQNPLILSRVYHVDWICDYDMAWYPFDSQKCQMKFRGDNFVKLVVDGMEYLGPKDLTQYFIRNTTMEMSEDTLSVVLQVYLGRRLLGTILTVYLPSLLMKKISYETNFFKQFFFEAVVAVNLTVMLVLATMFIAVSDRLPQTSYIKMVDVWLIFNLMLPFIQVILQTYIDTLRDDHGRAVNHHGQVREVGDDG